MSGMFERLKRKTSGNRCNDLTDHQSRTRSLLRKSEHASGGNSAVAPPVPIPNTAVKRCSPDGSTAIGRARVGRRQNETPLGLSQWGFYFSVLRPTRSTERRNAACRKRCRRRAPSDIDGQTRAGSGRANRSSRVNRRSPEPRHLDPSGVSFHFSGERTRLACP
jgi:hypothetical protein